MVDHVQSYALLDVLVDVLAVHVVVAAYVFLQLINRKEKACCFKPPSVHGISVSDVIVGPTFTSSLSFGAY